MRSKIGSSSLLHELEGKPRSSLQQRARLGRMPEGRRRQAMPRIPIAALTRSETTMSPRRSDDELLIDARGSGYRRKPITTVLVAVAIDEQLPNNDCFGGRRASRPTRRRPAGPRPAGRQTVPCLQACFEHPRRGTMCTLPDFVLCQLACPSYCFFFMWTLCTNLKVTPEALCGHMRLIHELEARMGGYQD